MLRTIRVLRLVKLMRLAKSSRIARRVNESISISCTMREVLMSGHCRDNVTVVLVLLEESGAV